MENVLRPNLDPHALARQPGLSYGGIKQSGLGKEQSFEAMLDHFTQKKTIIINMA